MTIEDTLKVLQQRTMIIWEELRKLKASGGIGGGDHVIEVLQGSDTTVNLTVIENALVDIDNYIKQAVLDIKGANSTKVFDCGPSIPACSFNNSASWDIYLDENKYWLGNLSETVFPDTYPDNMLGTVVRATDIDAEAGLLLCTSFTNPAITVLGNVKKSGDNYYLDTSGGSTFIPVEAGKNYRCKEVIDLTYFNPRPFPGTTVTGYLYIWEDYDGCSIHDAKEEILAAIQGAGAGVEPISDEHIISLFEGE